MYDIFTISIHFHFRRCFYWMPHQMEHFIGVFRDSIT